MRYSLFLLPLAIVGLHDLADVRGNTVGARVWRIAGGGMHLDG